MKPHFRLLISCLFPAIAASSLDQPTASSPSAGKVTGLSLLPPNVVSLGDTELRFGSPTNTPLWKAARDDDQNPLISGDGLTVFYISTAPGGLGEHDIWMIARPTLSSNWSLPVNLGPTVNSTADEGEARLSFDGLSLYLTSNRPGGLGGYDIWVATRQSPGQPFNAPVNLGPDVNSASDDGSVAVSADNRTLVFASFRPGSLGSSDLWISTRSNAQASWGLATNLGDPVSTSSFEISPCLSPDGLTLFFLSDRHRRGAGSIWVSKRATTDSSFCEPVLITEISESFSYGADSSSLSADGSKLYFNAYLQPYPNGSALEEIDVTALPQLKAPRSGAPGQFRCELIGREGATYEIQSSSDCKTWTPLLTTNTTESVTLSLPTKTSADRSFYRALSQ